MAARRRRTSPAAVLSTLAVGVLTVLSTSCGSSAPSTASTTQSVSSAPSLAPIQGQYAPSIDPSNFVTTIDNPFWPLRPGTTFH